MQVRNRSLSAMWLRTSMPALFVLIFCSAGFMSTPLLAQTVSGQDAALTFTHAFQSGQHVHLEMNVGTLHIVRSPNQRQIQLVIAPTKAYPPEQMHAWVTQFEIRNDKEAFIQVRTPQDHHDHGSSDDGCHMTLSGGDCNMTLYIPSETSLDVGLNVGTIVVQDIRGDKELRVNVGELDLNGIHRGDYGKVVNSTDVGLIDDPVFHSAQSGLVGKTETIQGSGKYSIDAKVNVGKIKYLEIAGGETD